MVFYCYKMVFCLLVVGQAVYKGGPKGGGWGGTNHSITLKFWQNHASRLDIWIAHVSRLSAWVDYRLLSGTSWCLLYMLKTLL
jgi:hypothetical protein